MKHFTGKLSWEILHILVPNSIAIYVNNNGVIKGDLPRQATDEKVSYKSRPWTLDNLKGTLQISYELFKTVNFSEFERKLTKTGAKYAYLRFWYKYLCFWYR